MGPEAKGFNQGEKPPTLLDTLPKPLESYPPIIQLYITVAAQQDCELSTQQALLTYAVYMYGGSIPKSDGQHPRPILFIDEISQILGISISDVKRDCRFIEDNGVSEWEKFEKNVTISRKNLAQAPHDPTLQEEQNKKIIEYREAGLTTQEIAQELKIPITTLRARIGKLIQEDKIPKREPGRRRVEK